MLLMVEMVTTRPGNMHLDEGSLTQLGDGIGVPSYARDQLRRSIVHIGVGGFHRAHFATYIDDLCRLGEADWSIVGAGVLPGDWRIASILAEQDHLYTLIARGTDNASVNVIGSIVEFVHAADDPAELIERIADPDTQIVSLTVTEAGYPVDDITGEFLPASPNADTGSAFGVIAAGLQRRLERNGSPITILSCDNVFGNGRVTRTATLGAAGRISDDLARWVSTVVAFPNSMVDRITPATHDTDRAWLAEKHGLVDGWPVVTEPFRQWVVEDRFAGDRLPLERLDVIVTDDVEPYEIMKLRLLNAGHSCLAYLSALLGIETVDEAMADPSIGRYVSRFLTDEARPVVTPVAGVDLDAYVDSLVERFSNPNIGDQIARLCVDGTAKFPKFLMPTVELQLEADGPVRLAALALAGWCEYLRAGSDPGSTITMSSDPGLDTAVAHARASADEPSNFLDLDLVFDPDLRTSRFAAAFDDAVSSIRRTGVRSAIAEALG